MRRAQRGEQFCWRRGGDSFIKIGIASASATGRLERGGGWWWRSWSRRRWRRRVEGEWPGRLMGGGGDSLRTLYGEGFVYKQSSDLETPPPPTRKTTGVPTALLQKKKKKKKRGSNIYTRQLASNI